MEVCSIKLKNFRSHKNLNINFSKGINILVGKNGTGKTNILEAIYLLATTKSFRARYDRDLINYDSKIASIAAKIYLESEKEHTQLDIALEKSARFENMSKKHLKINGLAKTHNTFCGVFTSVLFSPQDIDLIIGSPSDRRRYMDMLLSQISSSYKKALDTYTKATRQRNKLLELINKTSRGYDQLEYWDSQIISNGQYIQQERQKFFDEMSSCFIDYTNQINKHNYHYEIVYKKNEISKTRLESHLQAEIASKTTLVGPHRDDFEVSINKHMLSEFGSRGQQRSAVLSLKMCELVYIESYKRERPVLLLDDIFSELDEDHKETVYKIIDQQQTIITTAEKTSFIPAGNMQELSQCSDSNIQLLTTH